MFKICRRQRRQQWAAAMAGMETMVINAEHDIDEPTTHRCSAFEGAGVVDAMLNRAMEVIERRIRRRESKADRGGRGAVGARVVHWETKLIELVNVAIIDALASTGRGAEGAEARPAAVRYLQSQMDLSSNGDEISLPRSGFRNCTSRATAA